MRNPLHTPFVAVFQNEVLLNSKRVAPYALMILFAANAALWWLIPNAIFLAAAALALGVLLRDRYVTYAFGIGTCAGLFYLYSQGHNGWLYNPVLHNLWKYSDLTGADVGRIVIHRSLYSGSRWIVTRGCASRLQTQISKLTVQGPRSKVQCLSR